MYQKSCYFPPILNYSYSLDRMEICANVYICDEQAQTDSVDFFSQRRSNIKILRFFFLLNEMDIIGLR